MRKATWPVRMVGLAMLIFSAGLAVAAGSLPPSTADLSTLSWGGLKLMHLILGTAGAGASLFFLPQFTAMALGRTVTSGILCAFVGTPLTLVLGSAAYRKFVGELPPEIITTAEPVIAVALGVVGVYLIPVAMALGARFKANPTGFVGELRNGKPPGGTP